MDTHNTTFRVITPEDGTGMRDEEFEDSLPPVPPELSERVAAALAQRTEREQMSMAGSWAREAAKNTMQASLDIHRAFQTARIAMTVEDGMRKKLAELSAKTDRAVAKHPELELDYREMQADTAQMLRQLNKVTAVGYFRRYHRLGQNDTRD